MSAVLPRRTLLTGASAVGAAVALHAVPGRAQEVEAPVTPPPEVLDPGHDGHDAASPETAAPAPTCELACPWEDPASWPDGRVPGPGDVAEVTRPVIVTGSVQVAGIRIRPAGHLIWNPATTTEVRSTGNVVVEGVLEMRPSAAEVDHVLGFDGVDETAFVGGGMAVLDSDVGLWVVDHGLLDLQGHERTGWSRAAEDLPAGATSTSLEIPVSGWVAGDEVAVVPTAAPGTAEHLAYDLVALSAAGPERVDLAAPLATAHPQVRGAWGAEVLNLTRNVRVEGTPQGRAHVILLHCHRPQVIRHAVFRHLGPRPTPTSDSGYIGRYPLHLHHCEDGVRGSLLEGLVVRDSGNRAFVVHESNGVTLTDCVAHQVLDDAYWWDAPSTTPDEALPESHDVVYTRCVASAVHAANGGTGRRIGGFSLGAGTGNVCQDSVAVGVNTRNQAAGFTWPALSLKVSGNVWTFSGCRTHNNGQNGMFVWQNEPEVHLLERFEAFHNGVTGIELGAYTNNYQLVDGIIHGNGQAGIRLPARSRGAQLIRNVVFDGGGLSADGVQTSTHLKDTADPTLIERCAFTGHGRAGIALHPEDHVERKARDLVSVVDCTYEGNEFWIGRRAHRKTTMTVVHEGARFILRKRGRGAFVPAWNAHVESL